MSLNFGIVKMEASQSYSINLHSQAKQNIFNISQYFQMDRRITAKKWQEQELRDKETSHVTDWLPVGGKVAMLSTSSGPTQAGNLC